MTKAAVCKEVGAPLEVLDVDLDAPKAGEVRLQLGASGVCHSDLSVTNGTLPVPLPAVLGHEGAGTVTQVGDGVDHLKIGDHVVISWVPQCGACYFCKHDQGELCEVGTAASMSGGMLDMTTRFSIDGQPLNVMAASGTFSEETVVPAIGAVKIGATDTVNAGAGDPVAQVMELSGGRGADVAFEVIGLGPTIDQAFQM